MNMGINAQPSSVDSQGNGLAAWLDSQKVAYVATPVSLDPSGLPLYIDAAALSGLMATDPWLDSLNAAGIISTAAVPNTVTAAIAAQSAEGNGGTSDANGAATDPAVSGTPAAGDTGNGADSANAASDVAADTSAQDNALTLALSSFLKSADGQYEKSDTAPEYTAAQDVIDAALAADPTVQLLLDNGTLAVTSAVDAGNDGAGPDANGNSQDATGSGGKSDASDDGTLSDSSGAGSDTPPQPLVSPDSPTPPAGGDVTGNGGASADSGTSDSSAAGSDNAQPGIDPNAAPSPAPAPAPAPVVTPTPVAPSAPITETSAAVAWLEDFAKTASTDARSIINSILAYVREMKPGRTQTEQTMQRQQMNLHAALIGTINRLDAEFKPVWGGILKLFHEHRDGVFHERYVFRQLQNVPMAKDQREAFQNVVNMIKLTADPQGRKVGLKQFDKDRSMKHGLTEQGRNKLLGFYNL
jgi:hypothetical protein